MSHSDRINPGKTFRSNAKNNNYPGERLVACRNPRLAARRAHTRESLLKATEADLAVIRKSVDGGTLRGRAEIGVRVGQAINRFRMKKHMNYEIGDTSFAFSRNAENIAREAALDGIYVIRTSLPEQDMAADDCVRSYKALTRVETVLTYCLLKRTCRSVPFRTPGHEDAGWSGRRAVRLLSASRVIARLGELWWLAETEPRTKNYCWL